MLRVIKKSKKLQKVLGMKSTILVDSPYIDLLLNVSQGTKKLALQDHYRGHKYFLNTSLNADISDGSAVQSWLEYAVDPVLVVYTKYNLSTDPIDFLFKISKRWYDLSEKIPNADWVSLVNFAVLEEVLSRKDGPGTWQRMGLGGKLNKLKKELKL